MFLIKWWRYLRGYLVISVKGSGTEKLINLAIMRGIGFWDLERKQSHIQLSVALSAFKKLRPLIRKSHTRLHIMRRAGLPFLKMRLKYRWGLVVGALFFCCAIYLASSFVWFIRVTGNEHIPAEEIIRLAGRLGVKPGVWKGKLSLYELEQELVRMHNGISWAGFRLHGTLLEIEIVEHMPEPEPDLAPADLIAAKDGLVERVLVIEGQAVVSPGDTVSRGELLIKGIKDYTINSVVPEDELPRSEPVRARGTVEARVWYEARTPLKESVTVKTATGRIQTGHYFSWPGGRLYIWGARENPFEHSYLEVVRRSLKWRNHDLPVELVKVTYHELLYENREISSQEALRLGRREALAELQKQIPEEARVAAGPSFEHYEEQGLQWIRAVVETREDIAELRLQQP